MELDLRRYHLKNINGIIVVLLSLNLVTTVWFGLKNQTVSVEDITSQLSEHELPKFISKQSIGKLLSDFQTAYNSGSKQQLYGFFGPRFSSEISPADAELGFTQLWEMAPTIESGQFSHSKFISAEGGSIATYELYYEVNIPKSIASDELGRLTLTIFVSSSDFEVGGAHLHVENMLSGEST